ncbi:DUF421 domain-containing protein [Bacillus massilinigeriensis]|uniref:DUF421 domain-containing protein n=1 Tax=Bacillus mediterraneensis TaxID=1805474 RepID=UPI0008F81C68|nr:DUF421 domain-containing protein [Bacillus mediterraneensis]
MDQYLMIAFRTLLLYALIIFIFRLMGKREVGELSLLDLVVFIMIAEIAVLAIEETNISLFRSLLPIFLLVSIQMLLAYISLKSKRFRDLIDGRPTMIINNGKIDEREMRRHRYNFDDLLLQLRQQGYADISLVDYAILEPSGNLSVFSKDENSNRSPMAVPMIVDGTVMEDNLKMLNKSQKWLEEKLKNKGFINLESISFCSYNNGSFFIDLIDAKK